MTTPPSVEADLGWALGAVMRSYLDAARDVVADLPGGPRGFQVLVAAGRGEPGSQLALAQRLGVDRTVMTYLLDDLEAAGLVERRPDPTDRRARRVAVTEAGHTRLCALERALRDVEDGVLEPLEPAERDVLRSLLHRVATARGVERAGACQVAGEMEDQVAATTVRRGRRRS